MDQRLNSTGKRIASGFASPAAAGLEGDKNKMKSIGTLFLCLASASFAASWTGSLIDANCHDRQQQDKNATTPCTVSQSTAAFALQTTDGKVFKLDASGNAKASTEIRKDAAKASASKVKVEGTAEGQMIKVDSIDFDEK